jgi:tetratricopeptide (TPR) repeat protein
MDSVLNEAELLLFRREYREAVALIRNAAPTPDRENQQERRRFLAWATLATGDTKQAYELFWSCAQHPGARAGILLLTVLAGQVETAMDNWCRHLEKLKHPPLELPDERWHTPNVVLPALRILERYPFRPKTEHFGAAGVYRALLHQSQGDAPGTFQVLGEVTEFYLPARLLRDRWMDDLLCLPLPKASQEELSSVSAERGQGITLSQRRPEEIVARAVQILLYPDLETLQGHCTVALDEGRYLDALETLRRLLFLDPQHTPSLEKRWRLYLKLGEEESAKQDLFYLMDLYEREKKVRSCQRIAGQMVDLFPDDERALLKMCFLQARLGAPNHLARYGKKLLSLCQRQGLDERANSYRRWLLRQSLSLDDRTDFEVS